jgi:hypothetical protein
MNLYCDRYSVCNSMYMDRGSNTEEMARAKGWIVWQGETMGGKLQEVILCDLCVDASRRRVRHDRYEPLPDQYPIPELKIVKPDA